LRLQAERLMNLDEAACGKVREAEHWLHALILL